MFNILREIIYSIYGVPCSTIILLTVIVLTVYTFINISAPQKICRAINHVSFVLVVIAIVFFTLSNRTVRQERPYSLIPFIHYFKSKKGIETLWLNAF